MLSPSVILKKLFFIFILTFWGVTAMAIEEPKFELVKKMGDLEIRQYEPILVAETFIQSDFDSAGNKAFRILADYIFGNNKAKQKIAMTAPVVQEQPSQKIAMTAPVNQIPSNEGYMIQFTMPAELTMETVPTPNDNRVQIRQVPARKMAVYTYSGGWGQEKYNQKLAEMKKLLAENNLKFTGEPVFARYNSPFSLWFLRRNEIWLQLEN